MYQAADAELGRQVAVKLFRLDVPPEKVHQFAADLEKLIAAGLAHPGIAVPIAAGIVETSAWLASDLVVADSLDVVVRDYGPAPAADAVRIATEIAGALDFAAVVNVTHGMLHPRDILIASDEVRLTGLGIARPLEALGVNPPVRRPYTAPERTTGGAWDRRADVFSLAAVTFELLFGRRVAGTGEQAREAVTELAGANVRQLRAVFARALADDPAERFDSALEFAEQLRGAFSDAALIVVPRPDVALPAPPDVAASGVDVHPAGESAEPAAAAALNATSPLEAAIADLDLRAADSDAFASVVGSGSGPEVGSSSGPEVGSGLGRMRASDVASSPQIPADRASHPRSLVWPIAATALVSAAVGALIAFVVLSRGRPTVPEREFTETTVTSTSTPNARPDGTTGANPPPIVAPAAPVQTGEPQTPPPAAPPASERQPAPPAASPAQGRLLVRSTPDGAHVFVDGKDAGTTPATVHDLRPGTHVVRIARDGYATEERRVAITDARPARSLTLELTPQRVAVDRSASTPAPATPGTVGRFLGTLLVDSRPSGAAVFVDGKMSGTTPLALNSVDAGSHALRIELPGYQRWTSAVRVVAGERNRVTASLER